ncbi:DUF6544 family protein [Xylanimonas allomyrinae]|uniref:DUF6544 family protein n=1 Tax=Xylanimonas allomyrinae TaxID=2509459 RepID=UPI0013A645A8|nr:DUF6544 family protein [Xylanimonas allomyrinae]
MATALAGPAGATEALTERDLDHLPDAVARYVRRSGAVGLPRVTRFRATLRGRIRSSADGPWMAFLGEQVNTYGPHPTRLFLLDATMRGLPVDVLHVMAGGHAVMHVDLLSLVRVVDGSGPAMNQGETVTVFNDLCILAPGALPFAPVTWETLDEHHVRGIFTAAGQTVTAILEFSPDGDLVDFVSDDRLQADARGREFTPMRWSTPISGHRELRGRRTATAASAVWHAPEGAFTYAELEVTDLDTDP